MTDQLPDILIWRDRLVEIASPPPLPKHHPQIRELSEEELATSSGESRYPIPSTACWRGYVATWAIEDGKLLLTRIDGRYQVTTELGIVADWYTGPLLFQDPALTPGESLRDYEITNEFLQQVFVRAGRIENELSHSL